MPSPTLAALEIVLDSHESRLQRVETQSHELIGSVAEVAGDVKGLTGSFSRIELGLDDLQKAMAKHAQDSATRQDSIMSKVVGLEQANVLDKATTDLAKATSDGRWWLAKKAWVPAGIALTAGLVKLGEWLFGLLFGS